MVKKKVNQTEFWEVKFASVLEPAVDLSEERTPPYSKL